MWQRQADASYRCTHDSGAHGPHAFLPSSGVIGQVTKSQQSFSKLIHVIHHLNVADIVYTLASPLPGYTILLICDRLHAISDH